MNKHKMFIFEKINKIGKPVTQQAKDKMEQTKKQHREQNIRHKRH